MKWKYLLWTEQLSSIRFRLNICKLFLSSYKLNTEQWTHSLLYHRAACPQCVNPSSYCLVKEKQPKEPEPLTWFMHKVCVLDFIYFARTKINRKKRTCESVIVAIEWRNVLRRKFVIRSAYTWVHWAETMRSNERIETTKKMRTLFGAVGGSEKGG